MPSVELNIIEMPIFEHTKGHKVMVRGHEAGFIHWDHETDRWAHDFRPKATTLFLDREACALDLASLWFERERKKIIKERAKEEKNREKAIQEFRERR